MPLHGADSSREFKVSTVVLKSPIQNVFRMLNGTHTKTNPVLVWLKRYFHLLYMNLVLTRIDFVLSVCKALQSAF